MPDRRIADHLAAAFVTASGPAALAALWLWLAPAGCDLRGDPAVYRWTCVLPGLFLAAPAAVAATLLVAAALSRGLAARVGASIFVTGIGAGLAVQVVLAGAYLLALAPAYRASFLTEIAVIPQPFIAGAVSGAVHAGVLKIIARRRRA